MRIIKSFGFDVELVSVEDHLSETDSTSIFLNFSLNDEWCRVCVVRYLMYWIRYFHHTSSSVEYDSFSDFPCFACVLLLLFLVQMRASALRTRKFTCGLMEITQHKKKTTRNGNSAKFEYILIMLMASTHCVFPSYCYGWCMPSVVVSVTFYFNQWMELFVWEIMLCVRIERIRRWLFDLFHEWSVSITRTPFLFKRSSGGWKSFVHNSIIPHFYWFHYYSLVSIFRILFVICAFFLWQKMQSVFVWRKIDTTIIQEAIGEQNVTKPFTFTFY